MFTCLNPLFPLSFCLSLSLSLSGTPTRPPTHPPTHTHLPALTQSYRQSNGRQFPRFGQIHARLPFETDWKTRHAPGGCVDGVGKGMIRRSFPQNPRVQANAATTTSFHKGLRKLVERRARDRKVASLSPDGSGGRIFSSRVNILY